jgi:16S rRNA (uracil1498-N3)-methyltransferase
MHLFITDQYTITDAEIHIQDERIIHQCYHVLRMKTWHIIQLQDNALRYTLDIKIIIKREIIAEIVTTDTAQDTALHHTMCIALPNRFDKAELIVQKLTEIGIHSILFRKAERSIIHWLPDRKLQRLETIALEASEQSFRRDIPSISYLDNLRESHILTSSQTFIFNYGGTSLQNYKTDTKKVKLAIIGPEWGFTSEELQYAQEIWCITWSLWDTILRMETAAIIWWRLIQNS